MLRFLIVALSTSALILYSTLDSSKVNRIEVSDDFTDSWECFQKRAHYSLESDEINYKGTGEFFVVGRFSLKSTIAISIPISVVEPLVREVMKSKLEEKEYKPRVENICIAHYLRFTLRSDEDSIEFFTFSEGHHNKPWQVKVDGKLYVTNSSAPHKLLEKLVPYLHLEIRDSLCNVIQETSDSARENQ